MEPTAAVPSTRRLLRSIAPAPAALVLQLGGYALGWHCVNGIAVVPHAFAAVALLLALWAVRRSWRVLQQADAAWQAGAGTDAAQARFVALGLTVVAVAAAGAVLLAWFPLFLPEICR